MRVTALHSTQVTRLARAHLLLARLTRWAQICSMLDPPSVPEVCLLIGEAYLLIDCVVSWAHRSRSQAGMSQDLA